jgi:pyruvate dehydrogenase E1 component alpha subunit
VLFIVWISPDDLKIEMVQLLDESGALVGKMPDISDDKLCDMYRQMVFSRMFDERSVRLQRQGRIGTYAPFSGQEGAQVGSAFAIRKTDWIFASYRELPALFVHGMPPSQSLSYTMGHVRGGYVPENVNAFPVQIIIAGQMLHAVGSAWASQYLNDGHISVCYLGDGATSQGDFHESLNFASVFKLPVVFFVQNNGWAISVPRHRQSASATIAQKALAYGMPGIQVDGNDILAVYQVMRDATERARAGEGPVLIEAVTFRQGPHTTSDDPTRYRDPAEVEEWLAKDPIVRFKRFLIARGLWDDALEQETVDFAQRDIAKVVEEAEQTPKGTLADAIELVYVDTPPRLRKQSTQVESTKSVQEV